MSIKPPFVFISLVCLLALAFKVHAQETHFYTAAHQDDWQLFMNPQAYNSVKNPRVDKTVFIHVTSGDAGQGAGFLGEDHPYLIARNEGALRAIRFMVNANRGRLGAAMNESAVTLNGHTLQRYEYSQAVAYFLKLPDGNLGGQGFSGTGNESLQRLYSGAISQIETVDGSATYYGWDDLVRTAEAIVDYESPVGNAITFNSADTDTSLNPGDHSDHLHSSLLMQAVALNNTCINQNFYRDYVTSRLPDNVSKSELLVQAGTWGVTTSGISDFYHANTWDGGHNAWLGKQYYRSVAGDCSPSGVSNLASQATVTASSDTPQYGQTANKSVDGFIDGWPGNYAREWATAGQRAGAWLRLTWDSGINISYINLYDRPNTNDHITSAQLIFSDGTVVNVAALQNNGAVTRVNLPRVVGTRSVELRITGVAGTTANIGLSEIEVMGSP
ncbi:MAG: DUF7402 domain-containing protein [Cellvibrionaceae bacterium]